MTTGAGSTKQIAAAVMALAAFGVYLLVLAWLAPAGLHAPPLVLIGLAAAMFAAAIGVIARRRYHTVNAVSAAIVFFCFAGTGFWIALSPYATGGCTVAIGSGAVGDSPVGASPVEASPVATVADDVSSLPVSASTCRVVFGTGAVMSTLFGAVALFIRRR